MPTANKARGELELEVDGRSFVLRPSFETLSKIEDVTNKGAVELIQEIRAQTIQMKNIVVVLWMAVKGNKENSNVLSIDKFGESIRRGQGLPAAGFIALGFLSSAISTDQQIEEAAAETAKKGDDTKDADPSKPSEEPKLAESEPDPALTE